MCYVLVAIIEVTFSNEGKERLKVEDLEGKWTERFSMLPSAHSITITDTMFDFVLSIFFWWSKPDFHTNIQGVSSDQLSTLLLPELQPLGWKWNALASGATSLVNSAFFFSFSNLFYHLLVSRHSFYVVLFVFMKIILKKRKEECHYYLNKINFHIEVWTDLLGQV